ncbi:MAG: CcmD family protein [Saprospiraceae bacterium]
MYFFQLPFVFIDNDFLRSTGKIYVVALVSLLVWIGIIWYLIRLEKRLKEIDDQTK